jgi:hypothetical protein
MADEKPFDILDVWAEAYGMKPPTPPETPDQKMMKKLGLKPASAEMSSPLTDAGWLSDEQVAERDAVTDVLQRWRDVCAFGYPEQATADEYSITFRGKDVHASDLQRWQDSTAYAMLVKRYPVSDIRTSTWLTVEEIAAVAERHEIVVEQQ